MAETGSEVEMRVSEKLKQAREDQGLSLEAVAEKLNLSVEQIGKIEQIDSDIAQLSPFERGYIRNYANLLECDISEYEAQFPDGIGVGSELHSVQRYSYKVSKPFVSRKWVKRVFYLLLIIAVLVVLSMLNINIDDFKGVTQSVQESPIALPDIKDSPEPMPLPEQE